MGPLFRVYAICVCLFFKMVFLVALTVSSGGKRMGQKRLGIVLIVLEDGFWGQWH